MAKQILLISSRQRQALRVQVALLRRGIMVEIARTFRRGLAIVQYRPPDAIVLETAVSHPERTRPEEIVDAAALGSGIPVVLLEQSDPAVGAVGSLQPSRFSTFQAEQLLEMQVIVSLQRAGLM